MKRFYIAQLFTLVAVLALWNQRSYAQIPITIAYSTSPYLYTVPSGVFTISIDASGASGGTSCGYYQGGKGGRVSCVINTTPGSVLQFLTGGAGVDGNSCCSFALHTGGFNGGGNGYDYGASGGGASDVRVAPYALANRIVVAAGGGGGSCYCGDPGGNGGGLTGSNGTGACSSSYAGSGATQTGPGAGSSTGPGGAGSLGVGGNGYASYYYGAGGGGGLYGGGGSYGGGGGGGSSFTDASYVSTAPSYIPGSNSGNGTITFTPICTPPTAGVVNGASAICLGLTTPYTTTISAGGVWTSSNTTVATIDQTGLITSVTPGTSTISYSVSYSCGSAANSKVITINPPPTAILGSGNACFGKNTTLSDATPGGSWSSSSISIAKVGSSSGVVTGVSLGTVTITYKLPTTCFTTFTQLVNPIPAAYITSVTNAGQFCLGGTGVNVILGGSESGVNYDIYDLSNVKFAGPYPGSGVGTLNLGLQTKLGGLVVIGTKVATGCPNTMLGSNTISNSPLPFQYNLSVTLTGSTPSGSYCTGNSGLNLYLQGSEPNTFYQLYSGAMMVGTAVAGTGGTLDFGVQPAGSYKVVANNTLTGCTNGMANSAVISINPLPNVYNVKGGGSYCSGTTGVRDSLSGSQVGVNYELLLGGASIGSGVVMSGTGSAIDFGLQTAAGSYTVTAYNPTTTCSNTMSGSASIVINPLPTQYNVSTGGHYCSGSLTGAHVTLNYADVGVDYKLYKNSIAIGGTFAGSGALLDFGAYTIGDYTVVATNHSTSCVNNMLGTDMITIDNPPTPFIVTDGGNYCAGGTGVPVGLNGSEIGTRYQLYIDNVPAGAPVAGIGSGFSFGLQTVEGTYTVSAYNTVTTCSNNMNGSTTVAIDKLPKSEVIKVTNGGTYCVGGSGVTISLDSSSTGDTYQLLRNGIPLTDGLFAGTGTVRTFGIRKDTGVYSITAVNAAGCSSNMTGSVLVALSPLPTPFTITGGGAYCNGGTANNIMLSYSEPGVNYQLYKGVTLISTVLGTGASIDFGAQGGVGNYTVTAANVSTGCVNNMTGSVNVSTTNLPFAYNTTGGGNYCSGTPGVHVYLSASNSGIDYQLYNGTVPMGGTIHGTGYSLDFGLQTVSGNYKIIATNASSLCTKAMNGSVNVNAVTAPDEYAVTGGGNYCAGGAGKSIGLAASDTGVTYQLWNGSTMVGSAIAGTGSALDFGIKSAVGTYTVKGINTIAGCTTDMSGNAIVTLDPLPVQYTVSGGGSFCSGGVGSHVYLSGSNAGVRYDLNNNLLGTVSSVSGTGLNIDFGEQPAAGTYTVVAVNTTSSCTSNMLSSALINVIPLPVAHKVLGGGAYCAGGTGVGIELDGSESGIKYQLYNGTTPVGFSAWGVGDSLDLGVQSAAGTYTVKATNPATGCSNTMNLSAVVAIVPVVIPAAPMSSDMGSVVCAGTSVTYTATPVNGGSSPVYEWHAIVGTKDSLMTTTSPVMTYIPGVTGELIKVIMHSNAACAVTPDATSSMVMTVRPNGLPSVAISSTPGLSVCPGSIVILAAASPAFGGTAPTYKWTKNGSSTVLGTGATFSYIPANNDKVYLQMNSNEQCRTADSVLSNVTLTVKTIPAPVATIESNPATTGGLVFGQSVTLKAVISANPGTSQTYQWILNSKVLVGETANTLTSDKFFNNDSVACIVTAIGDCDPVSSSVFKKMSMHNLAAGNIAINGNDIRIMPNPNKGNFTVKGTINSNDEVVALEVVNMLGQVVYNDNATINGGQINKQVQLGINLANGMYILNVRTTSGNSAFHFVIGQ